MTETLKININSPAQETHCSQCGTEYKNIGHPLKPGVIMMVTCDCTLVMEEAGPGTTRYRLVPPGDPKES